MKMLVNYQSCHCDIKQKCENFLIYPNIPMENLVEEKKPNGKAADLEVHLKYSAARNIM